MYFEINVSLNGQHYFATAKRSLADSLKAAKVFADLRNRFPANEGFKLSISYFPERGYTIDGAHLNTCTETELYQTFSGMGANKNL